MGHVRLPRLAAAVGGRPGAAPRRTGAALLQRPRYGNTADLTEYRVVCPIWRRPDPWTVRNDTTSTICDVGLRAVTSLVRVRCTSGGCDRVLATCIHWWCPSNDTHPRFVHEGFGGS